MRHKSTNMHPNNLLRFVICFAVMLLVLSANLSASDLGTTPQR